jgi:hypothetical protein
MPKSNGMHGMDTWIHYKSQEFSVKKLALKVGAKVKKWCSFLVLRPNSDAQIKNK